MNDAMPLQRLADALARVALTTCLAVSLLSVTTRAVSQSTVGDAPTPIIRQGVIGVRLRERGSLLVDQFEDSGVDTEKWRIWHNDPSGAKFSIEEGRFVIRASDRLRYNGLWSLNPARMKDVTLVARMNIVTYGPRHHDLLLHLCGGDMPVSPDHWVEIAMRDIGNGRAQFSMNAAIEQSILTKHREAIPESSITLDRHGDDGFLARLSLDGSRNICTCEVQDVGGNWHAIESPIPLYLRTTHCEVKIQGRMPEDLSESTTSVGWFDDVRIYPRAIAHPIMVRLVAQSGDTICFRKNGSWPPMIQIRDNPPRPVSDLIVELWTADGKSRVAKVQSNHFAHYMLPVDFADWDVFPVGALIRVTCDGNSLGEVRIPLKGMDGLFPNDVYDVILN